LVNPDNPTGTVHTKEHLKKIVDIAKEYDLFLVVDEIYQNIILNDTKFTSLSEVIDNVPAICMK
jgi:alanine-synthesizing transaminase